MTTLLYGGAFNPITNAHLLTAREAMERGGFSQVIFIPTGYDGYKGGIAPFEHRVAMLKLAIHGHDGFDFSPWEGERAKDGYKSYTIDTFRHMRDNVCGNDIWWLIGSDNIEKIAKWKNYETIKKEMRFVVLPRPGYPTVSHQGHSVMDIMGMEGRTIQAPLLEISSTYVRERLLQGKTIRYLVPESVETYIFTHRLYKGNNKV